MSRLGLGSTLAEDADSWRVWGKKRLIGNLCSATLSLQRGDYSNFLLISGDCWDAFKETIKSKVITLSCKIILSITVIYSAVLPLGLLFFSFFIQVQVISEDTVYVYGNKRYLNLDKVA